ncbi:hypothetical protein L0Y59_04300, partial [Candidatus Uhrbacteria bacterium]|nr:hypothetical protein [Candidatus Uhrbacteria bacterium]
VMAAISLDFKSVCAGGGHAVVRVTVGSKSRDIPVSVDDAAPTAEEVVEALGVLVSFWLSRKATRAEKRALLTDATVSISSPTGGTE